MQLSKRLKNDFFLILASILVWRVLLFLFVYIAVLFIPLQRDYLGGGMSKYMTNPFFWSFANFDGEHYIAIAREGYRALRYFFFPLYPQILRVLAIPMGRAIESYLYSGLFVSNLSFLFAVFGVYKLLKLDYKRNIVLTTILLLLIFPTSFYFAGVYTESMFLALAVWTFYFARKRLYLFSGILGFFASLTRVVGVALFPALLIEIILDGKLTNRQKVFSLVAILPIVLGLVSYMYYLNQVTSDPLEFLHSVSIFGEHRSSSFILLPQVFYRYFFKILPNMTWTYLPFVYVVFLELFVGISFMLLSAISFIKVRLGYATYLLFIYLIPTLSGSFSSLPRYVIVGFPAFIVLAIYLVKLPRFLQFVIYVILFVGLTIGTMLFVRGFWLA